ncbi:MAG: methionine adenosyltransferase [Armatimonadota bacterium]|nr:methionine adenosyltransferase [Armatimonadota bacterium]MCX7776688.1 methionine adenosyltransferase [Armatimonadota bacterium]MDW8026326.1 methionine adenosyltransferase [Armatimonadota bacterium]
MHLRVNLGRNVVVDDMPMEIVERKGKGHPDTLCDGAAEELSRMLCLFYREHTGRILHHNVDKCVLAGGRSSPQLGGGAIEEPIYVLLVGRATLEWRGSQNEIWRVPIGKMVLQGIQNWFQRQLPNLPIPGALMVDYRIKRGSEDLIANYDMGCDVPRANDTSLAVAFAPLSVTEQLVKEAEMFLNSPALRVELPAIGEDIKVMGVRTGRRIRLTIAAAFIDRYVRSVREYYELKEVVKEKLKQHLCENCLIKFPVEYEVEIELNTADEGDTIYITVTGTSAECGDDGQVGRGNRINGLITPYRPMSLEAAAGKNPVSHVGKIYQVMAQLIANRLVEAQPQLRQVYCYMVSQIGHPITDPQAVNIEYYGDVSETEMRQLASSVVEQVLSQWREIQDGFVEGLWGVSYPGMAVACQAELAKKAV